MTNRKRIRAAFEALAASDTEPRVNMTCDELAELFKGKGFDAALAVIIARNPSGTVTFIPLDAAVAVAERLLVRRGNGGQL